MLITKNKPIGQIKKEFNENFPALKIEFYNKKNRKREGFRFKGSLDENVKGTLSSNATIGQVCTIHGGGAVTITPSQTVVAVEQDFLTNYGLNVEVFYKSGDTWFQTTSTEHWTLSEQVVRAAAIVDFSRISS